MVIDRGGFDAFVCNPPFMGGKKITGALSVPYRSYLVTHLAGNVAGHADLCSYFLLRADALTRESGFFGFVATNSIAEGDTRDVGLNQLVEGGHRFIGLWQVGSGRVRLTWKLRMSG